MRSKWAAGKAVRAGLAVEGAYLDRYVTEEHAAAGPFSSKPCRQRAFWPAALSLIGKRPPRVFSLFASRIQPKFAAAPLRQSLTWCTSVSETGRSSVSTTNIRGTDNAFGPSAPGRSLSPSLPQALRAWLLSACPSGTYQPVPLGQKPFVYRAPHNYYLSANVGWRC